MTGVEIKIIDLGLHWELEFDWLLNPFPPFQLKIK